MKFKFLILLVFLYWHAALQAQSRDSSERYHVITIKTNPLPIIMNEVNLSFEYRFAKHHSMEVMGAYMYATSDSKSDYLDGWFNSLWFNKGKSIRVNYKYFLPNKINGTYISAMYLYRERFHDIFVDYYYYFGKLEMLV